MTRMPPDRPLPPGAKCSRCRGQATIPSPSNHANFCPACFVHYVETAVTRALKKFRIPKDETLCVAVSGGKDSLALWQVLSDLGVPTRGLHVNLGIEGFSGASSQAVAAFATPRGLPWIEYCMTDILGHTIPEIMTRTRRPACSFCGMVKRQMLNRLVVREGLATVATGHNLDDEAGRLLGNIVRHREEYIAKQFPYLASAHPRLPAKAKPLYRLEAKELRTYCRVKGIEPLAAKCPLSRGSTSHSFQEALDFLEARMPATKRDFLFTHLRRKGAPGPLEREFGTCRECGEPTWADLCGVCTLMTRVREAEEKAAGNPPPVPLDTMPPPR